MPDPLPQAFLSYTRLDNEFFGGEITSLRKFLELGVKVVTGQRDFGIFHIDGIEFGQSWQKILDSAISGARVARMSAVISGDGPACRFAHGGLPASVMRRPGEGAGSANLKDMTC